MRKYVDFGLIEEKPKTKVWGVYTKNEGELIGIVSWYASWRQYCLEPDPGTVWARSCLRDVASFIEEQMEARV